MAVVREAFKPEFLNRLDEILVFHRLDREDLARIVELQVARLAARLADRRLTLELTPAARAWLADRGYDPAYGARPLRRLVAKAIGDELARRLLGGELSEGDAVLVDADGDRLSFTRRQRATVS
jgi:ATP-dependent Clp protease ATP-binding subunit ClpB